MKNIFYLILLMLIASNCNTIKSKFVFEKVIWAVDWSPDGRQIAYGGNSDELRLRSGDGFQDTERIKKLNTITKIKWHPDGKLVAITRQGNDESGLGDASAEIINTQDDSVTKLDRSNARGLGWNKSGDLLALGDYEGELSIYNIEGKIIQRIQTEQKSIIGLSWHPDGNRIVTVGSHIEIIDLKSEESIKVIPREIEILMLCVEWHPSGDYFVTGDYGDTILDYPPLLIFWNANGEKIKEIKKSKFEYRNLKWTQDGEYLSTASEKIRIWSKNGDLIGEKNLGSLLWGIDWNHDDTKLVTTSADGKIFILDSNLKSIKIVE